MVEVSVVIPTFDRAGALPRAIRSVLNQTVSDIEVIVVDDASTDDTEHVVSQFSDDRLTYLRHETNRGGSAARNTGIEAAQGKHVAFLDSDDAWRETKLERQLSTLENRSKEWVAAYCDVRYVAEDARGRITNVLARYLSPRDKKTGREGGRELIKYVLSGDLLTSAGSTLLVESSVAKRVKFDESFDRFQDSEFLIRVLEEGKMAYVGEKLVYRYLSSDPDPDSQSDAQLHYLRRFSDLVVEFELGGHDVLSTYHHGLAKSYLEAGDFQTAQKHVVRMGIPDVREIPGLVYAAGVGLISRDQ